LINDEEHHFVLYDKEMENLIKFGDNNPALQFMEQCKIPAGRPIK
jgi:hypothetical protein